MWGMKDAGTTSIFSYLGLRLLIAKLWSRRRTLKELTTQEQRQDDTYWRPVISYGEVDSCMHSGLPVCF